MKQAILIILSILFLNPEIYGYERVTVEQYIENGIVKTRRKNSLEGIGPSFIEKVKVVEEKDPITGIVKKTVSVFLSNCKDVELKDAKAQELQNGDAIRFKLGSVSSCEIKSWEKYKF